MNPSAILSLFLFFSQADSALANEPGQMLAVHSCCGLAALLLSSPIRSCLVKKVLGNSFDSQEFCKGLRFSDLALMELGLIIFIVALNELQVLPSPAFFYSLAIFILADILVHFALFRPLHNGVLRFSIPIACTLCPFFTYMTLCMLSLTLLA